MTKNDVINDVVSSLVMSLDWEQLELVKSTFIVKMQGYEIREVCLLPSTEVRDNDFIFKRFMVDCPATVHVYRKTFASCEYRRTGDVKYVSILLGHSSTTVTEKYYLVDDMKDIEYKAL